MVREIHEGVCVSHLRGQSLENKVIQVGYFWPTLRSDYMEFIKRCDGFQRDVILNKVPPEQLHSISSTWPFNKYRINIFGPFLTVVRQLKYLIVAMDYFTKWAKVELVAKITSDHVKRFIWRSTICQFGIPRTMIVANGTQFASNAIKTFCTENGICLVFTFVEHPQTNGQVEAVNKTILNGLKVRIQKSRFSWTKQFLYVLCSYHMTPQSSTRETPFSMV